jgi:hypothetical protein
MIKNVSLKLICPLLILILAAVSAGLGGCTCNKVSVGAGKINIIEALSNSVTRVTASPTGNRLFLPRRSRPMMFPQRVVVFYREPL